MNNFLDNLRNLETGDDSDNFQLIEVIRDAANNLGENAKKMLEIGIVQDELVKLGFKLSIWNTVRNVSKIDCMINDNDIGIYFWDSYVFFDMKRYPYDSPTFRQDFLNKVKEIINDK